MAATYHFRRRVGERIGNVDADTLADGIFWAIDNGRADLVEYVCRVTREGMRVFRFRVPDGRVFLALIDTEKRSAVTVFPPGRAIIPRQGKKALEIAE